MSATMNPLPTLNDYVAAGCAIYDVSENDLLSDTRAVRVTHCRRAICAAAYLTKRFSAMDIANRLHRPTHSGVLDAVKSARKRPAEMESAMGVEARAREYAASGIPWSKAEPRKPADIHPVVSMDAVVKKLNAVQETLRRIEDRMDAANAAH